MYHKDGTFIAANEDKKTINEEILLCGYFVIITSEKMTAKEAIRLYKGRDVTEKLFRGDKSYLGNKSMRVYSNEALNSKLFIEFVALILRNKMYRLLKENQSALEQKNNYMTVPASIRELDKIEMICVAGEIYKLDHAITSTQKQILKAYDIDSNYIKKATEEITNKLRFNKLEQKGLI